MIIFRKKTNEEILSGKNDNEEGKKGDSKAKKNAFLEWYGENPCISLIFIIIEEILLEFYVLFDAAVDAIVVFYHLVL